MFNQVRHYHDDTSDLTKAVTAITSSTRDENGVTTRNIFLIEGIWYGKDVTHIEGETADEENGKVQRAWKVRVVPILAPKLKQRLVGRRPRRCRIIDDQGDGNLEQASVAKDLKDTAVEVIITDRGLKANVVADLWTKLRATFNKADQTQV